MRPTKIKRPRQLELNVIPMIDVIFVLIVFFMAVSQTGQSQAEIEKLHVALPAAQRGEKPVDLPVTRVVINMLADGKIVVDDTGYTVDTLPRFLDEQLKKRPPAQMTVLIRGDKKTPWRNVARTMLACSARNITKVRVAVAEAENAPEK